MNALTNRYLALAAALLFAGQACAPDKPIDKYAQVAEAYCECTGKLADMNRQMAVQVNDSTAVLNLQAIEAEYLNVQSCAATLVARYGKLNTEEQKTVLSHVATRCPDLGAQPELLRELLGQ